MFYKQDWKEPALFSCLCPPPNIMYPNVHLCIIRASEQGYFIWLLWLITISILILYDMLPFPHAEIFSKFRETCHQKDQLFKMTVRQVF